MGLLVQDKVWLAWIGTIKGLVFALVTALLLYLLLRAWGQRDAEHQAEPAAPQSKRLVAVFALLALLFPLLIFGAVHLESARIRQEAQGDLNTIAQLKTGQIEQWLAERRGDAAVLMASDGFIDEVNLWFQIGDHNAKAQVDQRLEAMTRAFGYQTELLDTKLHSGNAIRPATLTAALKTRQVQMSELYRDNAGRVWLDFVVPLFKHAPSLRAVGAVALHAPAGQFLFPLLQTWPTPSPSAEFLLLRREGNSILFLNELRHRKNTALNFRLPLDAPNLPAAIAARSGSKAQIIAGRDYRGVPVLTAVRPVRGTSWFLVAKVDEDELMAPLRQLVAWVSMIAFAAFATVAAVVILLWRQQQRAHQLELLARTSKAVRDSEQRLAGLVDSAMDAIIAIDDSQRIVLFNPAAEEMFGLSAIQARGQPLDHLLPEAFRHVHAEHIREFGRTAITSRTVQSLGTLSGLRANGEEFPIEASISQSAVEGGKLYTVILRDITERRRSEALLRASEAQFRAIFEVSSVGMCQADPSNGKLVQVNRRFCEMTGYSEEELLGRPFLDILHPDDRTQSFAGFSRLVRGEIPEYRREERHSCKDGLVIWTDVTANVIHDSHLIPWRTIAIVQDITERKQAEETLRASEEKFRSLVEQASDGIFVSDAHGNYTEVN
ncbi:MAG TPA: PAS domain S-box protein, partial [Thiobacillaceae bacterium]|nr:PAS domain S-box protein [Thiobacillaceae bacterium]